MSAGVSWEESINKHDFKHARSVQKVQHQILGSLQRMRQGAAVVSFVLRGQIASVILHVRAFCSFTICSYNIFKISYVGQRFGALAGESDPCSWLMQWRHAVTSWERKPKQQEFLRLSQPKPKFRRSETSFQLLPHSAVTHFQQTPHSVLVSVSALCSFSRAGAASAPQAEMKELRGKSGANRGALRAPRGEPRCPDGDLATSELPPEHLHHSKESTPWNVSDLRKCHY